MKNKSLLTAGLVIMICSCLFAIALTVQPVRKVVYLHHKALANAVEREEADDEQGEFIIWKAIPRYLLTVNR